MEHTYTFIHIVTHTRAHTCACVHTCTHTHSEVTSADKFWRTSKCFSVMLSRHCPDYTLLIISLILWGLHNRRGCLTSSAQFSHSAKYKGINTTIYLKRQRKRNWPIYGEKKSREIKEPKLKKENEWTELLLIKGRLSANCNFLNNAHYAFIPPMSAEYLLHAWECKRWKDEEDTAPALRLSLNGEDTYMTSPRTTGKH